MTIDFADHLLAARVEDRVERVSKPGSSDRAMIRMPADSAMTFHFDLPDDATLVAEGLLRGSEGARLRVVLEAEGSPPRELSLERARGEEGMSLRFRGALPEAGKMVGIRFEFTEAPAPGDASVLTWTELVIRGTRIARPKTPQIERRDYNVLLIMLDSLRQDHIEPYGATEVATPALARLARTATTFVNARSNSAWTRPAVVSMFTSINPPEHGINGLRDRLDSDFPYLPEILRDAGYATLAVTDSPVISSQFAMDRGFEQMVEIYKRDDRLRRLHHADPEAMASFVWSRHMAPVLRGDRPFFVYLHQLDPHSPYDPPKAFAAPYAFDYDGDAGSEGPDIRYMRENPEKVEPDDIRHLKGLYRGEITFMDRYVGWILERLESLALERPTLLIFTSDHGEEFWDHESFGHAHAVHEELIRVPLIMRLDGVFPAGRRIEAAVSLLDLSPTILDLLGLAPPPSMQGESLLPLLAAPDDPAILRPSIARAKLPAVESFNYGRWKLIAYPKRPTEPLRLYDLEADPEERIDRAADHPIIAATLHQLLRWHHARGAAVLQDRSSSEAPADFGADLRRRLQVLGYIE